MTKNAFMKLSKLTLAACCLALSGAAWAQTPQVSASIEPLTIPIGAPAQLTIVAEFAEGTSCALVPVADTISANIEVLGHVSADTLSDNGITQIVRKYIVSAYDTGLFYVPKVDVVRLADGQTIAAENLTLNVVNPYQQMQRDPQSNVLYVGGLRDAHDAPFMLSELLQYWPYAVGLLLLAAAIVAGIFAYRRYKRRNDGADVPTAPALPCDVAALNELQRIREEELWKKSQTKQYYTELTDVLRRYISDRFGINALESTTDEIVEKLMKQSAVPREVMQQLRKVMELADFAKFAKMEPDEVENNMAINNAVSFVTATTQAAQQNEEN